MANDYRLIRHIGIMVVCIAGCAAPGASAPSLPPPATAVATSVPSTAIASPTAPVISPPTSLAPCPSLDAKYLAAEGGLTIAIGMGGSGSLQTTRVSTHSGASFTPPLDSFTPEVGIVPAGLKLPVEVWVSYVGESQEIDLISSVQLRSMEANLVIEGSRPTSVAVDPVPREAHVWALAFEPLPDSDGTARLIIDLAWEDRCFSYEGIVIAEVAYRSDATLASCTRNENGGWDQLRDLFAAPIRFGTSEADVFAANANTIFAGTPIKDGPYGLVMFDRDAPPHVAAPGESISFAPTNADLQLGLSRYGTVSFYRRAGVIRHQDEGGATQGAFDPPIVATSKLTQGQDGSFTITAPTDPARYVAAIALPYASGCSVGVAVAGPGLDVVAP